MHSCMNWFVYIWKKYIYIYIYTHIYTHTYTHIAYSVYTYIYIYMYRDRERERATSTYFVCDHGNHGNAKWFYWGVTLWPPFPVPKVTPQIVPLSKQKTSLYNFITQLNRTLHVCKNPMSDQPEAGAPVRRRRVSKAGSKAKPKSDSIDNR